MPNLRFVLPCLSLILCAAPLCPGALPISGEPLEFNRDVRPILSQYCFKCHGMDESARKGGLRLDTPEGALAAAKSGETAIVPNHPERSELLRRVRSVDAGELMPPPSAKMPLPPASAAILERWIQQGASYAPHWAFRAPLRHSLPDVKNASWVRTPVDRFVLARMEREGLVPSKEAPRAVLARRLYMDLTGLPPTPEQATAFLSDSAPDAYEKLVDVLLTSPRYGERWARRWLDLARYADTNGYEKDRPRQIWPYRDWVVQALNADMPFDQFSIKQLAGDMLPGAAPDDLIATGFHRNTMLNEEGGIDPLEFRFHAMTDRVATTGTVWLGLTLACAQCHTHKYDPILHTDYYRVFGLLNNADEPDYAIPSPENEKSRETLLSRIRAAEAGLAEKFEFTPSAADPRPAAEQRAYTIQKRFAEWNTLESARAVSWRITAPARLRGNLARLQVLADGSVLADGDVSKSDSYTLSFHGLPHNVTGLRLEVLPDPSLPAQGPGRTYYEGPKGDFFLSELQLRTSSGGTVQVRRATESYAKSGLGNAKVGAEHTLDGNPATGWSAHGAQGKANAAVFAFEAPADLSKGLELGMRFERHYACPLGRFRISFTTDAKEAEARGHSAEVETALAKPTTQRTPQEQRLIFQRFLETAPETAEARKEIEQLHQSLPKDQPTLVLRERPADNPRPTHLHHRGEFTQPREAVSPGVPAFLPPLSAGGRADRLAFARWLFAPEHPLTARVTVNRQWHAFFGRGLVRTLEDFGYQGEMPSHPELLDWLAVEFREKGWSLKQLHKLLVTSAVYRQSSEVSAELAARDPSNILLARGPRFRFESEQIRDAALAAAGLLSLKMGGPGVYPSQNPAVTKEGTYGGFEWKPSAGSDKHRRTLYTFIKRTAPFAMVTTFDGPSGESCVARRETSNSPLQALTLLNDVIFQEAAQALGKIAAETPGTDAERLRIVFQRCLTRDPAPEEERTLLGFLRRQTDRLATSELDAAKISGVEGEGRHTHAAWTALSRILLNLDECITKN